MNNDYEQWYYSNDNVEEFANNLVNGKPMNFIPPYQQESNFADMQVSGINQIIIGAGLLAVSAIGSAFMENYKKNHPQSHYNKKKRKRNNNYRKHN